MIRENNDKPTSLGSLLKPLLFKALGDETRIAIFQVVVESQSLNVSEVCSKIQTVGQPTVSKHLEILHTGGWLLRERRKNEVHYRVNLEAINILEKICEVLRKKTAEE